MFKKLKSNLFSISRTEIVKTSKLSLIATFFGIISNLSLNKFIALNIGPSGIAIFSQIQNLVNFSTAFSTGGIQNGVIKIVSEKSIYKLKNVITTSFITLLFCSSTISIFLILFKESISFFLFGNVEYVNHLLLLAFNLPFLASNNIIISILNGDNQIFNLVKVRVLTHVFQLTVTLVLLYYFGFNIGLLSFLTVHFFVFIITIFLILDKKYLPTVTAKSFDLNILNKLSGFSLIAVVSFALTPLTETLIRNFTIESINLNYAGFWDGLNKLSQSILSFFSLTLSLYFFPKFSSIKNLDRLKKELIIGLKFILIPLLIILFLVFFFKSFVIELLFSKSFLVINEYVLIQFIGLFFKTIAWVFGYLFISRNLIKPFLIFEIVFQFLYVIFSYFLLKYFGFWGLVYSFALINFLYVFSSGLYIFKFFLNSNK